MISLDNLSIVLALSSIGLSLHVLRAIWQLWRAGGILGTSFQAGIRLRAIWQLWRAGGISLLIAATACLILFWNDRS